VGLIECIFSPLLIGGNVWIRYREQNTNLSPLLKYSFSWITFLLIPIGAIAAIIGVSFSEYMKIEPIVTFGAALSITGLSGILALRVGDDLNDTNKRSRVLILILAVVFFLFLAIRIWFMLLSM